MGCSHGIIKHCLPSRVLDQDALLTPHPVVTRLHRRGRDLLTKYIILKS